VQGTPAKDAEGTSAKEENEPPKIRPSTVLEQSIRTSKLLPSTFDFAALPAEYRAVLTDLLMQRSIAQRGVNRGAKAKVDAANCIELLKSLKQDFLANRKDEFLGLSDFDKSSDTAQSADTAANTDVSAGANTGANTGSTASSADANSNDASKTDIGLNTDEITDADADRCLSMLAKADEKRYKSFLQHIAKELK
jgi:hypothetical protein